MRSSRSVFPSVCPFFSFSVLTGCSAFFLVLKGFNRVSRKFKGCLKFQWCFKEVLRMFQGSFKDVYRMSQGGFNKVSRVFQESFKSASRKFQGNFKVVLRKFLGCFK